MAEDERKEGTRQAEAVAAVEARCAGLRDQGVPEGLIPLLANLMELYRYCVLAAADILEAEEFTSENYPEARRSIALALMSKINVTPPQQPGVVSASGVISVDGMAAPPVIVGLPPGHPLGRGGTG